MAFRRNFCVDCKEFYECKTTSVILADRKAGYYVRCDLFECPHCGNKLIPRDTMGFISERFKNPGGWDAVIFEAESHGVLFEVEEYD